MALAGIFNKLRSRKLALQSTAAKPPEPQPPVSREADAIYQKGRLVARVRDPLVDLGAKEIRFAEIYRSDELLLPDECEFQQYRIVIQKVGYASRVLPGETEKGRVLKDCTADIVGYFQQ